MTEIERALAWLRERCKRESLDMGALTGQDARALRAFVATLELYVVADGNGRKHAMFAMERIVKAMQPKCRIFAKKVIPALLDWSDEETLWSIVWPDVLMEVQ